MAKILFLNRYSGPTPMLLESADGIGGRSCDTTSNHRDLRFGRILASRNLADAPSRMPWRVKLVRTFGVRYLGQSPGTAAPNRPIYFVLAAIAALRERADVVIAETDPPVLGVLGAALKFLKKSPFIYYCQDIYPDMAKATGALRTGRCSRCFVGRNQFAYCRADAVVALSE